jgi:two-component system, LuxR family, response regulator DctR
MESRICLLDDDESIRDSLEALFRSRRLPVSVYSDPLRFLSIWKSSELREVPATFVLHIRMPTVSGLEVFRHAAVFRTRVIWLR